MPGFTERMGPQVERYEEEEAEVAGPCDGCSVTRSRAILPEAGREALISKAITEPCVLSRET